MRYRFVLTFMIVVVFLALPVIVFAAGGHDGLTCNGCHSLHKAKTANFILAVEPNTKDLNPKTNQPYGGSTAICLGCHQTSEKGGHGMTPINGSTSHPYGLTSVNPKIAAVPPELIRNGRFECSSCHNPHPSNTNRKYLLIDTSGGASMETFCAVCHPTKADPKAIGQAQQFIGMSAGGQAEGKPEEKASKKRK